MAYTPATLSLGWNLIGGKYRIWVYLTTDAFSTVDNTDYFANAYDKGMREGDWVYVIKTDDDPPTVTQATVSAIDADGNATVVAVTAGNSITSFTVTESLQHGVDGTDLLGFYGDTPIARPASAAQSAVPTTAITTAISTLVTGTFGFVTSEQGDAVVAAVNSLIARTAANTTLVNALRAALITSTGLGLIKGAA